MRWITWTVSVAMAVLSFGVVMVQAQDGSAPMAPGPRLIHFSGVLLEAVGRPVKGVQGVNFAIYKEQQGGPALWIETQNVIADEQGLFAVLLGAGTGTGVPLELFTAGESRWLGIQAVGQEEQPRVLLVSVPYAIKAVDAERLGGLPVSAFARADVVTNAAASLASSVSDKGTAPISQAITTQTINAGYIPKFASDIGDLGNSIISESGGKIGVGTTTPKEKFQIGNRWSFSDGGHKLMGYNFYFGGTPSADRRILGGPADLMRFTDTGEVGFQVAASDVADSVINWKTPLYLNVSGKVGVNTTTPREAFQIGDRWTFHNGGSKTIGYNFYFGGTPSADRRILDGPSAVMRFTSTGDIGFQVGATSTADSQIAWTDAMSLKNNGNIGIGTSSPTVKLDVNGTVKTPTLQANSATITGNLTVSGASNGYLFPDGSKQTTAVPANAAIRGITYLAGCDTCGLLADTDDQKTIYFNVVGAMIITSVTCFSDAGTPKINLQRDDGTPANILSSDLSCSTSGTTTTSFAGSESRLNLNDKIDFVMLAAGGVAKRLTVAIKAVVQ